MAFVGSLDPVAGAVQIDDFLMVSALTGVCVEELLGSRGARRGRGLQETCHGESDASDASHSVLRREINARTEVGIKFNNFRVFCDALFASARVFSRFSGR